MRFTIECVINGFVLIIETFSSGMSLQKRYVFSEFPDVIRKMNFAMDELRKDEPEEDPQGADNG